MSRGPVPAGRAKEPIKIGVPTAVTGPYADLGNQVKRATDFAVDAANAAGGVDGRQVEVRYLDTEAKADLRDPAGREAGAVRLTIC